MPVVSVANVTPRGVIDFCRSRGVSPDGLLAAAGIPRTLVAVPGSRVSAEQAFALWEEAGRATGDPLIATHVATFLPFGAYRIADYLLVTGATPRDSLQKFIRSFPLVNSAFELQLTSSGRGTHLELYSRYAPEGPSRFYVEFIFAMIFARLQLAAGVDWRPKEVCFTHPANPGVEDCHPTFQCRTRFNEAVNQMVLERNFADMRLPNGDALLSEILDHYGQTLLKQSAKDDFLSDMRKVLSDGFSRGDVRLETTARKLAVSGRSLQRELNGRGTCYREELDRFRRDLAVDLLARAKIQEIAHLLQFSEMSSFYRAFRRWTGKTPQEYLNTQSSRGIRSGALGD
jgi:AraC-like DNA-binding protein